MIIKIKAGATCKVNGVKYLVRETEMKSDGHHGLCINPRLQLTSEKGETLDIQFEGMTYAMGETSLVGLTQFLTNG